MVLMNEQENLLQEIHDVIEAFAYNEISINIAFQEYKRLLNHFNILASTEKYSLTEPIPGIFFLHNSINYCKLTCILDRDFSLIEETASGDKSLLKLLKPGYITHTPPGKLISVVLHEDEGLSVNLYLVQLNLHEKCMLVSVSSSSFFDSAIFLDLGSLVEKYYCEHEVPKLPFTIDYFTEVSHDLSSLLLNEEKKGNGVIAVMIVFDSIEKIFGHMGLESLRQISQKIANSLLENSSGNPMVFVISLNAYIVVYSVPRRDIEKNMSEIIAASLEFDFYSINLPYRKSAARLDGLQSVYTFFEELYLFENYNRNQGSQQGDIAG